MAGGGPLSPGGSSGFIIPDAARPEQNGDAPNRSGSRYGVTIAYYKLYKNGAIKVIRAVSNELKLEPTKRTNGPVRYKNKNTHFLNYQNLTSDQRGP